MIKCKRVNELNNRIQQMQDILDELNDQRNQINNATEQKVDNLLEIKFGVRCAGLAKVLSRSMGQHVKDGWENSLEAPTLRRLAEKNYGDECAVMHLINGLTLKGLLIEKFYWMDEDGESTILDDWLQENMQNVVTLYTTGVDNFPPDTSEEEKTPFDPVMGEALFSVEEMKDGMIPIYYATDKLLLAIKEAEQQLVDTGEFEYV